LEQPLQHLAAARAAQDEAVNLLSPPAQLPAAVQAKQRAVTELEAALQSFAVGQQNSEGEPDNDDDQMDMNDSDQVSDLTSPFRPLQSDFLSDPVNRALPKPNFSAENLLEEERANATMRVKNKAARITPGEKDW
jgi:hypothetical protein